MSKAGVFDSGAGGLSLLRPIVACGIFEEISYLGDSARAPYGVHEDSTIIRYSLQAAEFFIREDVDFLLVACNTVSVVALDAIRAKVRFPFLGVLDAGVEAAKLSIADRSASILIVGTRATIRSQAYERALKGEGFRNVVSVAMPLLVPLVEEGVLRGPLVEGAFQHYLALVKKPDAVILSCTHFPFLQDAFSKFFPEAKIIHSGSAIPMTLAGEPLSLLRSSRCSVKITGSERSEALACLARHEFGSLATVCAGRDLVWG